MSTGTNPNLIRAADLFAGAGGFTTGLSLAVRELELPLDLVAVNHWDLAIASHSKNHPTVRHLCQSMETVNPREVVPGGKLRLLLGAPECIHFSNARGGLPMSDQSRSSAWCILRWLDHLDVQDVLLENVREFRDWGPLHPCTCGAEAKALAAGLNPAKVPHTTGLRCYRPVEREKGKYYRNFKRNLQCLGYRVDERILCAADYGDATTRERLFVRARKGKKPISWPEPTHRRPDEDPLDLYPDRPRWRAAREIIDWSIPSESIYGRKKPLADNTLRRIFAGLFKFSGLPFILGQQSGSVARTVSAPSMTVAGAGAISLVEPFLVVLRNHCDGLPVSGPSATIAAEGNHLALAQPWIFPLNHGKGDTRAYPLERTFPTVTSVDAWAIGYPCITEFHGERDGQEPRTRDVDRPLGVVAGSPTFGLMEPFIVVYNGTGGDWQLGDPLATVTGNDRFALVSPELVRSGEVTGPVVGWLDIRFRMLQPHELAAAQGFPPDYHFAGSRKYRVRQIGNSVPVNLAKALCRHILMEAA